MKTLQGHTIIYDDACPLCDAYTSAFVKSKMLEENGRKAFSSYNFSECPQLDKTRACNEIALVDNRTGQVTYGVHSLVKVLSSRFPFVALIMRASISQWLATKLYRFISYNRKVIIPPINKNQCCTPSFDLSYRVIYILFACIVSAVVLHQYSSTLAEIIPPTTLTRELLICSGQVLFQAIYLTIISRDKIITYLGNMMTVSLAGAFLLMPPMLIGATVGAGIYYFAISFLLVVLIMFSDHTRRVKLLGLHWSVSLSWILYRLIVLAIIL